MPIFEKLTVTEVAARPQLEIPPAPIGSLPRRDRRAARAAEAKRDWSVAELAYCAGIVDGEGSFLLRLNPQTATVKNTITVSNTAPNLIEWLRGHIGGISRTQVWAASASRPRPCHGWRWEAHGQYAADITEAIRPYLVIKAEEADLFLEFWRMRTPQWGGGRGHHRTVSPELRALREGYCARMLELRAAQKRRRYELHLSGSL